MNISSLPLSLPESGKLTQVNEYVQWLRMPLPFDLNHINLYLIKDDQGWAILDTGLGTNTTTQIWHQVLELLDAPITRVIVTHMHPDHIGMAGHLVDTFRVPLHMSYEEYFVARALVAGPNGADNWQDVDYLRQCGMDDAYIEAAAQNKGGLGKVVKPIPLQFNRLIEGQVLTMAGVDWHVMIGRGHSPEHVCLHAPALNTLISGDHILPDITPNIGAYSTEPEANPLSLYLQTLEQFKHLPASTQVLPSHKLPFVGLHQRVDQLQQHHHNHLDALLTFCVEPRTVKQTLSVLFKRELNPHNMFFAIAEALSHLNYLMYQDKLTRSVNDQGQWLFCTEQAMSM